MYVIPDCDPGVKPGGVDWVERGPGFEPGLTGLEARCISSPVARTSASPAWD